MKTFVWDTNVIVSAYMSPYGKPALLLSALFSRRIRMAYDARILAEYVQVLQRPHIGVMQDEVTALVEVINRQDFVTPILINESKLPDISDKVFMEAALATNEKVIVTGNKKHYPNDIMKKLDIRILTPAEALEILDD